MNGPTTLTPGTFTGAVAIVTGGASGIGLATATMLASHGARVAVLDWSDTTSDAAEHVRQLGMTYLQVDVSASEQVNDAFRQVADDLGAPDFLVHSAGVSTDPDTKARVGPQLNGRFGDTYPHIDGITEVTDEQWRRIMAVNADGTFYCTRAALRMMCPRGAGAIVLVGSNAGVMGEPGTSAYSASKGAVRTFTQSAAAEAIGYGVRVNSVAPGATATQFVRQSQQAGQNFLVRIPARRIAEPDEIGAAILYLLSPQAAFVIGETLNINGGVLMR